MSRFLLLTAALAITAVAASAQTVTQVCPATPAVCVLDAGQYLNRVVNDDATVNGATTTRKNLNRVYQLKRGEVYLQDAAIISAGYHLRIFGAEGAGSVPLVYATQTASSGNIGNFIRQQGDVTLRNVAFSGIIDVGTAAENQTALALLPAQVVRVEAAGFRLVMDNVTMSNVRNEFVRTESALKSLTMTNSRIVNGGSLGQTNLGNGKAIDLRDGSIDSLVIRNSTFTNFTDRIVRHYNSTGAIGVMIFDHNTVMNGFATHGMLALGRVGTNVQITNNLFFDNFVAGSDTSDVVRQAEFNESGEKDASGSAKMTWVITEPNTTTVWNVANNVFVVSPELQAFYTRFGDGLGNDGNTANGGPGIRGDIGDNDIIGAGAPLTDHIRGRITNPATAFVQGIFAVANRPATMVNLGVYYRTMTGRTKTQPNYSQARDDYDRRTLTYYVKGTGAFDASYPTSEPAYTAATGACPVGDLNWFPSRFADCVNRAVANEDGPGTVEGAVRLLAPSPNPSRSGVTLRYTLSEASTVEMTVLNLLGQTVATVAVAERQAAGPHAVQFEGRLAAGLYIVRLRAGDAVVTTRMTVVR